MVYNEEKEQYYEQLNSKIEKASAAEMTEIAEDIEMEVYNRLSPNNQKRVDNAL